MKTIIKTVISILLVLLDLAPHIVTALNGTGWSCNKSSECLRDEWCQDTDRDGVADTCLCRPGYFFQVDTSRCQQANHEILCREGEYLDISENMCVSCPLGRYKPDPGNMECLPCQVPPGYPDPTTTHRGATNLSDCVPTPYIETFYPLYGPAAGGTPVKIHLRFLHKLDVVGVNIAGVPCKIEHKIRTSKTSQNATMSMSGLINDTGNSELPGAPPRVTLSSQLVVSAERAFEYRRNPSISAVLNPHTFLTGGLTLKVTGSNLDSIARPILEITRVHLRVPQTFPSLCRVYNSTLMGCPTPNLGLDKAEYRIEKRSLQKRSLDYLLEHLTQYYIGFYLDGFAKYRNLSETLPGQGRLRVFQDPVIEQFPEDGHIKILPPEQEILRIQGSSLNLAADMHDYTVSVGKDYCLLTILATNELQCRVPRPQPEVEENGYGPGKIPRVSVHIGKLHYVVGYLQYQQHTPSDTVTIAVGVVLGIVAALLILGMGACWWRSYRRKKGADNALNEFVLSPNAVTTNTNGGRPPEGLRVSTISNHSGTSAVPLISGGRRTSNTGSSSTTFSEIFYPSTPLSVQNLPFDVMLEAEESLKLTLEESALESERLELNEVIGQGYFGQVYKGTLLDEHMQNPKTVAVKTIQGKYGVTVEDVKSFLQEAVVMKDFNHPHVLSLLGVVLRENKPHVVLPFMEHGDLKSYISQPSRRIKVRELLAFAVQIADGMVYLSSQKFVHRDLATRNCMMNKSLIVKIADFGLSRDIYKMDYYRVEDKHRPLPVKWMAIESLTSGIFSTKSDVWSYGVVMWELLTRGASPYPDVDTFNIKSYIVSGRRLHQPEFAPDEVFAIMCSCWRDKPDDRPAFVDLARTLREVVNDKKTENHPDYLQLV